MYLTVHGVSGLLIGSQIANPWLAFLIGFGTHFLLDMIPHDPIELERWYKFEKWHKSGNKNLTQLKFFIVGGIDLVLLALILVGLKLTGNNIFEASAIAAVAGALLPDFVWAGASLFKIKNRFTKWFYNLHEENHKLFYRPLYIRGIYAWPIQIILLGLFLWGYLNL